VDLERVVGLLHYPDASVRFRLSVTLTTVRYAPCPCLFPVRGDPLDYAALLLGLIAPTLPTDLSRLRFTSVEQALSAAQTAAPQLQAFLGGVNLAALPLPALDFIPPNLLTIIQNAIYSFGVPALPVNALYTPGAGLPPRHPPQP
jgi:hypothetical protein